MFDRIATIAWPQHGAFTTAQAADAGVSASWLSRAVADGRIVRRRVGIYVLAIAPATWRQDLMVEVLSAGRDALATGESALALWCHELSPPRVPVVAAESTASRRSSRSCRVIRAGDLGLAKPGVVDGIPVVGVARALLDVSIDCLPMPSSRASTPVSAISRCRSERSWMRSTPTPAEAGQAS